MDTKSIQEQIDNGAEVVTNGKPDLRVEVTEPATIDKAQMLELYRSDLAQLRNAAETKKAEFHVLTGKVEALEQLIAYHER